jgi:restriction endonuclease S subunit
MNEELDPAEVLGHLPASWNAVPAGTLFSFKNGLNYSASQTGTGRGINVVGVGDFANGFRFRQDGDLVRVELSEGVDKSYLLEPSDLLFVRSNGNKELVGRVMFLDRVDGPLSHSGFTIRGRVASAEIDPLFAAYFFSSALVKRQFLRLGGGTNISNLSQDILKAVVFPRPPLTEQRKIAAVLSTWDRAIELAEDLIAAKQQRKAALMQQLLTGRARFGTSDPEHQNVTVGEIVEKVATAIEVEATATYREIGVRSHGKGIFHKEPVLGSVVGEKRVYKVEPGCLTFNIVFAWEQAIAVTTTNEAGFICSHRFPMFRPKAHVAEPKYLLAYFLSPKGTEMLELASPGGAGRNRTLGQSAFLKLKVPLPNMGFQQRFVSLIDTLDADLALQSRKLDALRRQKKGLMQQLLTGKVRVKVTESSGE